MAATAIVAMLLAVAAGSRIVVAADVSVGTLCALALAPVWLGAASEYRWARTFLLLGALCAVTAPMLTGLAVYDHVVDPLLLRANLARLAELVLGVGALLWARTQLGTTRLACAYGAGMLIDVVARGESSFKFGAGTAVTVIVLAVLGGRDGRPARRGLQVVACVVLGLLFALDDARSAFAMLMLTAAVVLWQVRMGVGSVRRSAAVTVSAVVSTGLAAYAGARALILDGAFGAVTAQRTEAQLATGGNLLVTGRPESGATVALLGDRPLGFGMGVHLNGADLLIAKDGMTALGYDPDNGYVDNYMFGHGIELHSLFGDLWAVYGLAGIALWVFVLVLVLGALVRRATAARADALVVYLVVLTGWNLFFSPIYSSVPILVLTVVLLLARRPRPGPVQVDLPGRPPHAPDDPPDRRQVPRRAA